MILAELVRRGRGERILVVTPRHVLEQMQYELWTRFALPFVRLDSVGHPAGAPEAAGQPQPVHLLQAGRSSRSTRSRATATARTWRSSAGTPSSSTSPTTSPTPRTQNNQLARLLAPHTEALILASATPHNGKAESFAELIRLLDPTAVNPARRPRSRTRSSAWSSAATATAPTSPSVVGADWAERQRARQHAGRCRHPAEDAIAERAATDLAAPRGRHVAVLGGDERALFPWTLAKAFLSSPAACEETVKERIEAASTAEPDATSGARRARTSRRTGRATAASGGQYDALVEHLREIGVGKGIADAGGRVRRAGRDPALAARAAAQRPRLRRTQVAILHGGLSDVEQQEVVEAFKQESTPDPGPGHRRRRLRGRQPAPQCHQLIHYDIPWSLIRIEQRNGRIDRYGQRHPRRSPRCPHHLRRAVLR